MHTRTREHVEQELGEIANRIAILERRGTAAASGQSLNDLGRRRRELEEELSALRDRDNAAHEDPVTGEDVTGRNVEDALKRGLARFR